MAKGKSMIEAGVTIGLWVMIGVAVMLADTLAGWIDRRLQGAIDRDRAWQARQAARHSVGRQTR